jgi:predicted nucleic acid-binding Zn ribbon protein
MPIYVYEIIETDGKDGETFEVLQGLSEPPLTHHPENGKPVRRCISLPSVAGMWSDMKTNTSLSDKNLDAKGFTKYVKMGDGMYEKRAGQGPDIISAND